MLLGTEEVITLPGARSERNEALLEKLDTASATVPNDPSPVEPTLTAVEMQAGALSAFTEPPFPEEMTVAIPTERRLSMATLRESVSQLELNNAAPPRLILTEAKGYVFWRRNTRWSAMSVSDVNAAAHGSSPAPLQFAPVNLEKTCTAIRLAPLATPEKLVPDPVAIPAT